MLPWVKNIAAMIAFTNTLKERLKENNFLFSNEPSAADYLVWSFIEQLPGVQILSDKLQEAITSEKFPAFYVWTNCMSADEVVKATGRTAQQHADYMKKMKQVGDPVYDLNGKEYTMHASKEK